jgi:hypothetical protein
MKKLLLPAALYILSLQANSQAASYVDPAQAYNRLLLEKGNGNVHTRIGNYQVVGTPYLFGGTHKGNVYGGGEVGKDQTISYNTYTQGIEIQLEADKMLTKEWATVDSFDLEVEADGVKKKMHFINAVLAGSAEKVFFQKIAAGDRYTLYKEYKSGLQYVSTNIVRAELRTFDLQYAYYYKDMATGKVKKLKSSAAGIQKEFKDVKDLSAIFGRNDYAANPEEVLQLVFAALNQ